MWGGFSSSDWFQAGSKIKTLNSPLTHTVDRPGRIRFAAYVGLPGRDTNKRTDRLRPPSNNVWILRGGGRSQCTRGDRGGGQPKDDDGEGEGGGQSGHSCGHWLQLREEERPQFGLVRVVKTRESHHGRLTGELR